MQSHIRKVHACLAVTCQLHFWQNDRDLLRATAVTRGWNGYQKVYSIKLVNPGLLLQIVVATNRALAPISTGLQFQLQNVQLVVTNNYLHRSASAKFILWLCIFVATGSIFVAASTSLLFAA